MTDRTLTLIQEDGSEVICDILFTYFYEKTNKNYVVFNVRGTQEVSAATFEETNGTTGKLGLIRSVAECFWEDRRFLDTKSFVVRRWF